MRTRDPRTQSLVGAAVLALLLFGLAAREERRTAPPPLPRSPRLPLLEAGESREAPPLEQFARRSLKPGLTVEVIYATPLLPADEASTHIFRVIAVHSQFGAAQRFPADLGPLARLRTSDGQVVEHLLWQEELRGDQRLLGYLCTTADTSRTLVTKGTRWLQLTLTGLAPEPLTFRWPASVRTGGGGTSNLVE